MCMCVCVCVCACVRACALARARVCVCVCPLAACCPSCPVGFAAVVTPPIPSAAVLVNEYGNVEKVASLLMVINLTVKQLSSYMNMEMLIRWRV